MGKSEEKKVAPAASTHGGKPSASDGGALPAVEELLRFDPCAAFTQAVKSSDMKQQIEQTIISGGCPCPSFDGTACHTVNVNQQNEKNLRKTALMFSAATSF